MELVGGRKRLFLVGGAGRIRVMSDAQKALTTEVKISTRSALGLFHFAAARD